MTTTHACLVESDLLVFEEWQKFPSDGSEPQKWCGFIYFKNNEDAVEHLDIYDDYIDAYLTNDGRVIYTGN